MRYVLAASSTAINRSAGFLGLPIGEAFRFPDEKDSPMRFYPDDDFFIDANGCPTERVLMGGLEVVVHYDDVPFEGWSTTASGAACSPFTRRSRGAVQLDMLRRPGVHLLRKLLSR